MAIVLRRADLEDVPQWAAVSPYATILNCGLNNDGALKQLAASPAVTDSACLSVLTCMSKRCCCCCCDSCRSGPLCCPMPPSLTAASTMTVRCRQCSMQACVFCLPAACLHIVWNCTMPD